jgi:hypothetical protein
MIFYVNVDEGSDMLVNFFLFQSIVEGTLTNGLAFFGK